MGRICVHFTRDLYTFHPRLLQISPVPGLPRTLPGVRNRRIPSPALHCIQCPRALRVRSYDPQQPIHSGNATNHARQSSHHAVRRKITKSAPISGSAPRVTLDKSRLCVLRAGYGVAFVLPERCTITRDTRRIHSRTPRHTRPRYLHYYESAICVTTRALRMLADRRRFVQRREVDTFMWRRSACIDPLTQWAKLL